MNSNKKFRHILVASPSFAKSSVLINKLAELADSVSINDTKQVWTEQQFAEAVSLSNPDALIIGTEKLSAIVLDLAKSLRCIAKYGVGTDNIDIEAIRAKGVYFAPIQGVNRTSVAELVLSFLLGHFRNVFQVMERMQNGVWLKNGGALLSGKSIGIVGFGHCGQEVARLLSPFGCKLYAVDVRKIEAEATRLNVTITDLKTLINTADAVTLHVPADASTRKLLSHESIANANPRLLVINTSRGSVVDFEAVTKAVRSKKLGGFASDVFEHEPFNESHNYSIKDGFYFTSHIGGNAEEAIVAMGEAAIRNLFDCPV